MAQVSYKKLWNKLKENNMQKTDLYRKVKKEVSDDQESLDEESKED